MPKGYKLIAIGHVGTREIHGLVRPPGSFVGQEKVIILKSPNPEEIGMITGGYFGPKEELPHLLKKRIAKLKEKREKLIEEGKLKPAPKVIYVRPETEVGKEAIRPPEFWEKYIEKHKAGWKLTPEEEKLYKKAIAKAKKEKLQYIKFERVTPKKVEFTAYEKVAVPKKVKEKIEPSGARIEPVKSKQQLALAKVQRWREKFIGKQEKFLAGFPETTAGRVLRGAVSMLPPFLIPSMSFEIAEWVVAPKYKAKQYKEWFKEEWKKPKLFLAELGGMFLGGALLPTPKMAKAEVKITKAKTIARKIPEKAPEVEPLKTFFSRREFFKVISKAEVEIKKPYRLKPIRKTFYAIGEATSYSIEKAKKGLAFLKGKIYELGKKKKISEFFSPAIIEKAKAKLESPFLETAPKKVVKAKAVTIEKAKKPKISVTEAYTRKFMEAITPTAKIERYTGIAYPSRLEFRPFLRKELPLYRFESSVIYPKAEKFKLFLRKAPRVSKKTKTKFLEFKAVEITPMFEELTKGIVKAKYEKLTFPELVRTKAETYPPLLFPKFKLELKPTKAKKKKKVKIKPKEAYLPKLKEVIETKLKLKPVAKIKEGLKLRFKLKVKEKPKAKIKAKEITLPTEKLKEFVKVAPIQKQILKLKPKEKPKLRLKLKEVTKIPPYTPSVPFIESPQIKSSFFFFPFFKKERKAPKPKKLKTLKFKEISKYKPSLIGLKYLKPRKIKKRKKLFGIEIRPPKL